LNRRLAPRIYLGVAEIKEDQGRIELNGRGETVEYAVRMARIPEDALMDRLLERGRVTGEMIKGVAERLVRFYAGAETSRLIGVFGRPERVKQDTDENFEQTGKYIGMTLSREAFETVRSRTNEFFKGQRELFEGRISSGKIRDCHGDLRLEHIVWGEEIAIFDCIEFNQRFRYTDVAADIAFLAMDLDYHEREDLAKHLIDCYIEGSDDEDLLRVLPFYKCYRAYVRGKVESFQMEDPTMAEGEKRRARENAERYFALAYRYAKLF
jgi:uncharacterized protein